MTRQRFTPEFLNRLDDIVIFSPLTVNALHRILSQLMETVRPPPPDGGLPAVTCLRVRRPRPRPACGAVFFYLIIYLSCRHKPSIQ